MSDPIQASTVSPETIARLDASIAEVREAWDRLSLQHRIMMAIATTIETLIPSWLQLGPIAQFLVSARFLDQQYKRIGESIAWYSQIPEWIRTGAVALRPSTRAPSDVDIVIQSDAVPVPAFAQEVQTLGSPWVVFGVIAGLAGLKITTDFMATQEETQRKQLDFLLIKMITDGRKAGTLTEGTAIKLTQLMGQWKAAEAPEPDTIDKITTLAKWGIGIAIAVGALGLVFKLKDAWQERD